MDKPVSLKLSMARLASSNTSAGKTEGPALKLWIACFCNENIP
jgi:hypothetical protein